MSKYLSNGTRFGWGNVEEPLNSEKTALLDRFATGSVLDVGCAVGRYSSYLASRGHAVEGIDTEKELIKRAKAFYPDISFSVASAYALPKPKRRFGTVLLFDILEHVNDIRALEQAAAVGDRVIISVPRTNQDFLSHHSLAHHHYLDSTHKRTYTTSSLRTLLASCGYRVLYCREALPISLYSLVVDHLSQGSRVKSLLLKLILKPFMPEESLCSTVFAVADRKKS